MRVTVRIKSWDEFYRTPKTLQEMVRWATTHSKLVSDLARHRRVLEVGTGSGMLSAFLSHFCQVTIGLDNSRPVLNTAHLFIRAVSAPVSLILGDAFHLPFRDRSFEAAFSQGLLEHFSDADIVRLVEEQLRVAQRVYVSVPSFFYPHVWRFGPGLVGNERFMTLGRWRRLLSRFKVEGAYYPDFKFATFGGWTVPWPAHILLRISRHE